MVIRWLDSNIDDAMNEFDPLASDSADLKQKIELALDPNTTKKQIEDGDLWKKMKWLLSGAQRQLEE